MQRERRLHFRLPDTASCGRAVALYPAPITSRPEIPAPLPFLLKAFLRDPYPFLKAFLMDPHPFLKACLRDPY